MNGRGSSGMLGILAGEPIELIDFNFLSRPMYTVFIKRKSQFFALRASYEIFPTI
ncbi:hypothetical protein CHCC20327_1513 [Bacillus licheniformis]|nr:hypothetical protein CHCC20327_1513 [Bacillus licheniformis]